LDKKKQVRSVIIARVISERKTDEALQVRKKRGYVKTRERMHRLGNAKYSTAREESDKTCTFGKKTFVILCT